jgi:hypothetical protein
MDATQLIVQLILGAIGGNAAGAALKHYSLGPLGNTVAGIFGGGIGGQILTALLAGAPQAADAAAGAAMGGGSLIQSILGGGIGGAVLTIAIGVLRGMMHKTA